MKITKRSLLSLFAIVLTVILISAAAVFVSAENTAPELRAVSVSLDGQVNLKFKYSSLGDAKSFKIHVYGHGDSVINASDIPTVGSDRVITVSLLPSEMGREVTVTPYYGEKAGAPERYSVLKYAEKLIASDAHAAYHDTARAMLNWGSFVERHFEQRYDDLPNEGLFADLTNPAYAVESVPYTPSNTTKDAVFANAETSLAFGTSNTSLKFYVNYTGDASALKARLYSSTESGYEELGDKEFTLVKTSKEGFTHVFSVKNISVKDYATRYKLVITGNTGESATLEMSVLQYLNWNIGADSGTLDGEKNVCRSLYQLYQLAVGGVDGSCTHSGEVYRLANPDNTSTLRCAVCFETLQICGTCTFSESKSEDGKTYTYTCKNEAQGCRNSYTIEIPSSVPVYYSFRDLYALSEGGGTASDYKVKDSLTDSSYRITGTTWVDNGATKYGGQEIFFRSYFDSPPAVNYTNDEKTETLKWNVGNAEFFIIKVKNNDTTKKFSVSFSTTAVNRWENSNGEHGSETSYGTKYRGEVTLPVTNEWQTFVFNISNISDLYKKDNGNYVIDTLLLGVSYGENESLDIEYIAMANDWDGIDAIVEGDSVKYILNSTGDGAYQALGCGNEHIRYNFTEHWYEACDIHGVPSTEREPHRYDQKGLYYTCVECGFVPVCNGEHSYTSVNDKQHSIVKCEHCGAAADSSATEAHTYITNSRGEYICSLCGNIPACKGEHTFTANPDGTHSMTACNICGAGAVTNEKHDCCEDGSHVYTCSICKLEPACHGVHEYVKTETGHYIAACDKCGAVGSELEKHINVNCGDALCDICGYKLSTNHINVNNDTKCDRCGETMPDLGAYVLNGEDLYDMAALVTGTASLTQGDKSLHLERDSSYAGKIFFARNTADIGSSAIGQSINVGQAEYIIIKYKISIPEGATWADGRRFRMIISTSAAESANAEADYTGISTFWLDPVSSTQLDQWVYKIIHAPTALQNYKKESIYKKDSVTGDYIIDTLYYEPTQLTEKNNSSITIDYISFADDLSEIERLLEEDKTDDTKIGSVRILKQTYAKTDITNGTNPSMNDIKDENVVNGKIQHTNGAITSSKDADGNDVYTLKCTKCGLTIYKKTVPSSINYFLDPKKLASTASHQSTLTFETENGEAYYHLVGQDKDAQHIWLREKYYHSGTASGYSGGDGKLSENFNIGTAQYMVIKIRTNEDTKKISIQTSTTGYDYDMNGVTGSGSGSIAASVTVTVSEKDKWETIMVDLNMIDTKFAVDPITGNYIIDTFFLSRSNLASTEYIDIAYIAFVDGLEEAKALAANEGSITTISSKGSISTVEIGNSPENEPAYEWATEPETQDNLTPGEFSDGTGLSEAGASTWTQGSFASSFKAVDPSKAVTKTASEMLALLEKKDGVKAGEIYRVSGTLSLESDKTYYGNMAAIIAEGGVEIKNASSIALRDLIIVGSVTIESSSDITLYRVEVKGGTTGISIDSTSSDINITSSAVKATDTAISSSAERVSVYQSRLVANVGVVSSGSDMTVQDCLINAVSSGIKSSGEYFIARSNTVTVSDGRNGIGIEMTKGSKNSMAALNDIKNAQTSIKMTDAYNCVAVLNQAVSIQASNNKHLYVIKNRLGGELSLTNNNYLIGDGNTFISDGKTHNTLASGNQNFNGDNMHDVNVRLDVGANEELLPHTDTEQFTNMELRTEITDLASLCTQSYSAYVKGEAKDNDIVIIPPGYYQSSSAITFGKEQSNTSLYAYGSKAEATYTVGNIMRVDNAENVRVNGFTGSHNRSTCGQVQVLSINTETKSLIVTVSAGFVDGFYTLDPTDSRDDAGYNPDFLSIYHKKEKDDLSDIDAADIYGGHGSILKSRSDKGVVNNGDGTYTIYMSNVSLIQKGDIMVTRLGQRGQNSLFTLSSDNIYYKDLTLYSSTNSRNAASACGQITYERFSSPRPRGYEIDKTTFDRYEELEKQYGVNLGVYYDEEYEIYRGPDPIWGATACMEVNGNYKGTHVISSFWRSTTDDGTNQRGTTGRIAGMENNGDGTYTVYYKGNLGDVSRRSSYDDYTNKAMGLTDAATLEVGNTIVAYTTDGSVLIDDAIVRSAPKVGSADSDIHLVHTGSGAYCDECGRLVRDGYSYQEMSNEYDPATGVLTFKTKNKDSTVEFKTVIRSVIIDAQYVNEELLDKYDFCLNTDQPEKRVALDNVSKNSQGIYYDNVLITDIKSRAILAKASDVTIKNCTFRNLTLQALVLGAEEEWAEGTVARNVVIENNLFDNCAATNEYNKTTLTSYDAEPNLCPIDIRGVATTNEAIISNVTPHQGMVASNFIIRNNTFINTPNKHMISVTGARNVFITGNTFEERDGDGEVVYINGCANVLIDGNNYSERIAAFADIKKAFTVYNARNVIIEDIELPRVTDKP